MMRTMYATSEASKFTCPNWMITCVISEDAKHIFVATIGTLSGSHNSAQLGLKIAHLEEHPDTQIHVIDSLSAGGRLDCRKINDH